MPKRILIAEDEPDIKELLALIARRYGYVVVEANDGVDLLAAAAKEKFDLIITDIKMPNLDGAAASEILKMQGNLLPIIALTAFNPQDLVLVQDKFTKIFYKPCDVKELFQYVNSLIGE